MNRKEFRLAPVIACIIMMLCVGIVYMWNVFQQPAIIARSERASAPACALTQDHRSMFLMRT